MSLAPCPSCGESGKTLFVSPISQRPYFFKVWVDCICVYAIDVGPVVWDNDSEQIALARTAWNAAPREEE
jgi:hypothetical protein